MENAVFDIGVFSIGTGLDIAAGCSKRPSSKAAGGARTGGVPSGYVEDFCELRTPLADFFNSVLELVLRYAIPERIPGDLEEPACFGNIAACALQRFL